MLGVRELKHKIQGMFSFSGGYNFGNEDNMLILLSELIPASLGMSSLLCNMPWES